MYNVPVFVLVRNIPRLIRPRPFGLHSLTSLFRRGLLAGMLMATVLATSAVSQPGENSRISANLPSDEEIREILADRIDVQKKSVGMVVGIITRDGRRIITYGRMDRGDPRPLTGATVFEIGSLTKVFTALLFADMVQRGEVRMKDPLAKYLPSGTTVPERNGEVITLVDLATHTSGLPFQPPAMTVGDTAVSAHFSDEQVYKFLSTFKLESDIGAKWNYSNMGFGLLGIALARRAGSDYESLIRSRITGPLGMKSTGIAVSPEMQSHLGVGHNATLDRAPDWAMPVFAGAGSLRSSADDMLTFLAAFMGYDETPLAPAMAAMLTTRRPGPNLEQALGWWVIPFDTNDAGIVTMAGATFGYTTTAAYDPKTKVGVVVFSNSVGNDGGLAWHLLRPAMPVETSASQKALTERKETRVDTTVLDMYVGKYQPKVGGIITIERRGDTLSFKSPSAPSGLRLRAESAEKFFVREVDLAVTFQVDATGRSTGMLVRFGGMEDLVPRVEDAHKN